jgi:hypothetical protein
LLSIISSSFCSYVEHGAFMKLFHLVLSRASPFALSTMTTGYVSWISIYLEMCDNFPCGRVPAHHKNGTSKNSKACNPIWRSYCWYFSVTKFISLQLPSCGQIMLNNWLLCRRTGRNEQVM